MTITRHPPMPRITVIVPVHNTADCLPACLDAVLAQVQPDIDLICVDDGSTDASPEVLRRYMAADARVSVITLDRNRGVSTARNTGLRAASGEYVAFVDSDDAIRPDFCRRLYTAARREKADIAKGNYVYSHHDRIDYGINRKIREDKANFYIQCCAAIYRTAFLRERGLLFPQRLHASEDLVFAFRAANLANAVALDDMALIRVTARPGSATFAAPDQRTIISHYRALSIILQTALASGTARASFNHVTASLFALFARIAARNRDAKARRFVAAQNARLFNRARASPLWDAELFISALPDADKPLYDCLETNTLHRFFADIETRQARRCRLLRNGA